MDEAVFVEALENTCDRDHRSAAASNLILPSRASILFSPHNFSAAAWSSCATMLEEVESDLEEFWELQREAERDQDLDNWLCVERKNFCCPKGHYGPKCKVKRMLAAQNVIDVPLISTTAHDMATGLFLIY